MKTVESLQVTTPNDRDVVVRRRFDAPRRQVFAALTRPELLRRWYGPEGWTFETCEIDLRVGGHWRFVIHRPDGKAIGQKGQYREIVVGERLVNTESWEDWDAGETLVTTVLEEHRGTTAFTCTMHFPSREVRDIVLKNGLEKGVRDGYTKLDQLLNSLSETAG